METSKTRKKITKQTSSTKTIVLAGMLAGVYAVSTVLLGTISYGPLNLRFSNVLLGVVPLFGWPSVIGLSLGVLLSNISSPLGPIDLVSSGFSFIGFASIYFLRNKTVLGGVLIYSAILSLWVTFELSFVLRIPYFPSFYFILAGITLVDLTGYLLYRALRKSNIMRRISI